MKVGKIIIFTPPLNTIRLYNGIYMEIEVDDINADLL